MKEHPAERRPAAAIVALAMMLLMPVGYVLSIGPANWLVTNELVNRDGARWFYFPLIYLAQQSTTVNKVFEFYLSLFGDA